MYVHAFYLLTARFFFFSDLTAGLMRIQGQVQEEGLLLTMRTEVLRSFETSITTSQSTRRHIPYDVNRFAKLDFVRPTSIFASYITVRILS